MTTTITQGPRQSNFELLRIVAMFLVLIVHADFFSLGSPTREEFINNSINVITRTFFESISIICVNLFILISGWFQIKPSINGITNFIFQCLFFYVGIYLVSCLFGLESLNPNLFLNILKSFFANWFINSYIALYLLAPVLNTFINNSKEERIRLFIIYFFSYEVLFGMLQSTNFIAGGFSVFNFIGLYILGAYLRRNKREFSNKLYIVLLLISIFIINVAYISSLYFEINFGNIFAYINPLVLFSSTCIFILFSRIKIKHSKTINWLSYSSFAVFLFHCHPLISESIFKTIILQTYVTYSGINCLLRILFILIVFYIVAVIIDQFRILIWRNFIKPIINRN